MALMSNVILGAGFPGNEPSDEGKIIGIGSSDSMTGTSAAADSPIVFSGS